MIAFPKLLDVAFICLFAGRVLAAALPALTVATAAESAGPWNDEIPAWVGNTRDEPFNVKEFLLSRTPPDNAAPVYQPALATLIRKREGDAADILDRRIRELADIEKLSAGTIPLPDVEGVLSAVAPAIKGIDLAQAKPECVFITDLGADASFRLLAHLYCVPQHAAPSGSLISYHPGVSCVVFHCQPHGWPL